MFSQQSLYLFVPLLSTVAIAIFSKKYWNLHRLAFLLSVEIPVLMFFTAITSAIFAVWWYGGHGSIENAGTLFIQNTDPTTFASSIVNGCLLSLFSGALLGWVFSKAAPGVASLCKSLYLFVVNGLVGRPGVITNVQKSGRNIPRSFLPNYWKLIKRSLLFSFSLAIIYSALGYPAIQIPDQLGSIPVIIPSFVALVGFYSSIIPAAVEFLESNDYVIIRENEPEKALSEVVVRWTTVVFSISTITALISAIAKILPEIWTFMTPTALLKAVVSFLPAAFALIGSCISIELFNTKNNDSRLALFWFVPVILYRTDLIDRLLPLWKLGPLLTWYLKFGEFVEGTFYPFGFYWYPLSLVVGLLSLYAVHRFVSRESSRIVMGAIAGMLIGLGIPAALGWIGPIQGSIASLTWIVTIEVLNFSYFAYLQTISPAFTYRVSSIAPQAPTPSTPTSRLPFSIDAINRNKISRVETWPFAESGVLLAPSRGHGHFAAPENVSMDWFSSQLQSVAKVTSDFYDRRLFAISWLLTIFVGISSGLFGSALFGQTWNPSFDFVLVTGLLVFASAYTYFIYYPLSAAYSIPLIVPPFPLPSPLPKVNANLLSPMASLHYSTDFRSVIADYVEIIVRCKIRDAINDSGLKKLRVVKVNWDVHVESIFVVELELRSKIQCILDKNTVAIVKSEYRSLLENFERMLSSLSTFDLETNQQEWDLKGYTFLNELCKESTSDVERRILRQCSSDWRPQGARN